MNLAELILKINKKAHRGCKIKKWAGMENGLGQEFECDIDELVEMAKKQLKTE